jgi:mRNA-degrading endonuclease RelE of RelBE toxin-antitoxin system
MRIAFASDARKQLRAIPRQQAMAILYRLADLIANPAEPSLDVVKLTDRHDYRLRVGRFRVIFEVSGEAVLVTAVGDRKGVHRRKK